MPFCVSRYSSRCRSPSARYGTRRRIPWSTRVASRSVSTARGAPRMRWKSANRRTPRNASRSTSRLHFSPTTASVPATEHRDRSSSSSLTGISIEPLSSLDEPRCKGAEFAVRTQEASMDIAVATRPVQPDDEARFLRLWPRLSPETRYRRFHSPVHRLPMSLVHHLVQVDHDGREAVVPLVGGEVVGVARYDRSPTDPSSAEFAIVVEDAWQNVGLGRQLLGELSRLAARRGVRELTATVQADNDRMVHLIRRAVPPRLVRRGQRRLHRARPD